MRIVLFLIFCIIVASCSSICNIDNTKKLLTDNSIKYWDLIINDGYHLKGKVKSVMFNENNDYLIYNYNEKGNRVEFKSIDEVFENKFKIISCNLLITNGAKYDILLLSNDTLILQEYRNKKITKYINVGNGTE